MELLVKTLIENLFLVNYYDRIKIEVRMKRIMVFWLVLLFPIFVFAKEYSSDEID